MGQCQPQLQPNDNGQPFAAQEDSVGGRGGGRGRYNGECDELGRPHGQGKMYYAADESIFEGEFKEGVRNHGRLTLKNGDYY